MQLASNRSLLFPPPHRNDAAGPGGGAATAPSGAARTVEDMTMTDTSAGTRPRPLPLNTILKVNGVSFHQDVVQRVIDDQELRIRHDTVNPQDRNACAVETVDGVLLGHVPRDLAARLALNHPGGLWRARVVEVLRGETTGLRVRLGPLIVDGLTERAGQSNPGLRHRGDGLVEIAGAAVVVDEPAVTGPDPVSPSEASADVYAKSGRLLGTLKRSGDGRVLVTSPDGVDRSYPAGVVRIQRAA